MKLKTNIATSENGFIFNPTTGDSYMGNPVATEIIGLLKQENSVLEIKEIVLNKYEVEPQQFDRDLEDLIHQLKEANLLD